MLGYVLRRYKMYNSNIVANLKLIFSLASTIEFFAIVLRFNAMNTLAEFYLLGLGCRCDENEAMRCAYLVYEYARTCLREEYRDKFYVTYAYFLHHNIGRDPNPDKDKVDFWQLYSQGDRLHMPLLMQGLE